MKKSKLGIGVIGAGGRGWISQHAHCPKEGVRIIAACDTNPSVLKAYREKYGDDLFCTADYRELLRRDDVGAVFVTSPDFLHEEHAIAALKAGKDVYLEKPMTITLKGCDRVLRVAMGCKRKLYLGHNMRHMKDIQKMRELILDGAIGEVKAAWCRHFIAYGGDAYFKDWHAERAKSTGMLLQKAAHDIDILHWLCGGYTREVVAQGGLTLYDKIKSRHSPKERGDATFRMENWPPLSQKGLNPIIDIEDVSHVLMHLDNGVFATYQQCHFTPDAWRNYTVIGTHGRVENFGGDEVVLWNKRCHYNAKGDKRFHFNVKGLHGGADPRIVKEFIRYVLEGGKILTSPIAARNSVATGYLATDSLRHGSRPRVVPPVDKAVERYFEKLEVRS